MATTSRPSARRRGPLGPRKPVQLAERVHRLARLEVGLGDHYAFERVSTNFRLEAYVWLVPVTVPVFCMWYPKDPPNRQWNRADGVLELVDTAVAHLFKELYFQETGEWLGEEVHWDGPEIEQRAPLDRAA